jgi:hypothetical protein
MLDAPVAREIEHGFLAEPRRIEIAIVHHGSSSSVVVSATISPSGLTITVSAMHDGRPRRGVWPKGDF